MSIATDEALEWHGLHGDEPGDRDSTYSAEELDAAYIAGRTAEPTDAEIDAAINMSEDHIVLSDCDGFVECECGAVFATYAVHARHQMKAVLEAARKAVSK